MVRTSVVLAVIAAALLGYIFVFERGSITTGEREQRKGSALPEFVRARLSKLEIQRKGVTTVIERDPEADVESDAALWRVTVPYRAEADQEAVDTLLGELEWLDGRRRLEGISTEDEKRFGLSAPRYRLWFTVGTTRVPLVVGAESPRGDGVYVATGEAGTVHVVGKDFVEALDQEPGHFHTKALHDGVLISTTAKLSLRDAQGERVVRKRSDGLWEFERGAVGLASVPAVQELIDAADALRAKRFVAQDVKDLQKYGLQQPRFELTAEISQFSETEKDAKGKPAREHLTLRLRSGAACAGHTGESYVTVDDSRTVHCAADEDLAKLQKPTAALREARLLPLDDEGISGVELERGGAKLVLARNDETWSYEVSRAGKLVSKAEAREDALYDWLKALRSVQVTRFDAERIAPAKAAVTLRVSRKERPVFELRVDPSGSADLVALRGDEPQAVVVAASTLELLRPEAARFRKLKLLENDASALQRLEIRRDGSTEQLVRAGAGFAVKAPIDAPADPVATSEVARLLGALEAVRFAADAAEPSHGLSAPALSVTAEFTPPAKDAKTATAGPKPVVLHLGAATEGGRFAQLQGESSVFVLSSQLADLLAAPLVSRSLLATPLERLRAVELEHGPRRVRVERRDDGFAAGPGSNVESGAAEALARNVATLRAVRVAGYGQAAPAHGLDKPVARIAVTTVAEAGRERRYTIALGAEADGGRYARRDDQAVTFVLPENAVDALLSPGDKPLPSN